MNNASRTKRIAPFKAWAVVDANGISKPSAFDVSSSRRRAELIQRVRSRAAFPKYPAAKWRIARVEIREVK